MAKIVISVRINKGSYEKFRDLKKVLLVYGVRFSLSEYISQSLPQINSILEYIISAKESGLLSEGAFRKFIFKMFERKFEVK